MTRSQFLDRLETVVIVTVISVLVWLYAEGENVQTYTNARVRVKFVPPTGQELAIEPSEPLEVLLNIRASAGEMSRFERFVRDNAGIVPIEVGEERNGAVVVLREALGGTQLGAMGLNITSTSPEHASITVEPLVTRRLTVAPTEAPVQLAKPPTVEPPAVEVTMRASLAELADGLALTARLPQRPEDYATFEVNTPETLEVPLEVPPALVDPWTELADANAEVTFTIRKLTDTYRPDYIPIRISLDPLMLRQYEVEPLELVLREVTLTGPSDAIERIRRGEERVEAMLRPTNEQLERGVETLQPVIVAPSGVTTASPPPPVAVRIQRKPNGQP